MRNGGNAGLWYVNGNNALGNARWNIGSRQSGGISYYSVTTTSRAPERDGALAWLN